MKSTLKLAVVLVILCLNRLSWRWDVEVKSESN